MPTAAAAADAEDAHLAGLEGAEEEGHIATRQRPPLRLVRRVVLRLQWGSMESRGVCQMFLPKSQVLSFKCALVFWLRMPHTSALPFASFDV